MSNEILMIDDSSLLHPLLRHVLARVGFELHSALNGGSGIACALRIRPEAIILDIDLPDIDGWQILRMLKANDSTASIPVIILSADSSPHSFQKSKDLGAADFLSKPVQAASAVRCVANTVERARQQTHLAMVHNLNGLPNRAKLISDLSNHSADTRTPTKVACIVVDLDGLGEINQRFGKSIGDEALRAVADTFCRELNVQDRVYSLGGGTFAVLSTDRPNADACRFARHLLDAVSALPVTGAVPSCRLSCCAGIATTDVVTPKELLERAEVSLNRAKENGPSSVSSARRSHRVSDARASSVCLIECRIGVSHES